MNTRSPNFGHEPVMLAEVLGWLGHVRGGWLVDGTVGMGGHALGLLEATPPDVKLLGLDRDPEAVQASKERLARFGSRATILHHGYEELPQVMAELGVDRVSGVLLDLGLSSAQLASNRGFSFLGDAPLDMRFDPTSGPTAAQLIRELPVRKLAEAFMAYGELAAGGRLARRLKEEARLGRMKTTAEFAAVCVEVLGPRVRKMPSPTLPAQALRILANRELERLEAFLHALPKLLAPGGRAAVVSYHSLEDRRVKLAFRAMERGGEFKVLTRRPDTPSVAEVAANRRARSARLRVIERQAEGRQ